MKPKLITEDEKKEGGEHKILEEEKTAAGEKLLIKGIHLDICRHFISCKTILELISLMKKLGFNTLHLHLSDDQGFPIQSSKYPQIKFPQMLTIEDQELIAKACDNAGIDIIPEIDIPGHAIAFLHIFRGVPLEKKLGLVTTQYIDLKNDLPIILDLFEEFSKRFKSKYIHMGGDEARNYKEFPSLLVKVCSWANERKLQVIAWDDVSSCFKELETIPSNLTIQRWRVRTSKFCDKVPNILSQGYYLDHVDDPIEYYRRSPKAFGKNIGCIACIWTELIDENNFWCTVIPNLYMIALRWNEFPKKQEHLPVVLYEQCEKYGYPKCINKDCENSWKRRRWVGFYKDMMRSTSSVTVDVKLDRDHDQYPVFSPKLIKTQYVLYSHLVLTKKVDEKELEEAVEFATEATGHNMNFLKLRRKTWTKELRQIMKLVKLEEETHFNGMVNVFRHLLR